MPILSPGCALYGTYQPISTIYRCCELPFRLPLLDAIQPSPLPPCSAWSGINEDSAILASGGVCYFTTILCAFLAQHSRHSWTPTELLTCKGPEHQSFCSTFLYKVSSELLWCAGARGCWGCGWRCTRSIYSRRPMQCHPARNQADDQA